MAISVQELIFKTKSLIYLAEKEKLIDVAKHLGLDESKMGDPVTAHLKNIFKR